MPLLAWSGHELMTGMGSKRPLRSSPVVVRSVIAEQSGEKASAADMSRFTPTLNDRIYMAVEAVLDHHRRHGISEEQIRAVLDRAIIASKQLEATRALIKPLHR